jgi:anaerobic magnesium-protoporphyrin IX monomethyl ester cyclase
VTLSLQTSRGCPFGCTFCDIRRSTLRQRSPDSVVAEIQRWYRQGVRTFFFADDNFVLNKKWTLETCEKIAAQGLKIDFKISARVDLPDLEMYRALKRAGCSRVNFGVESGNQNNLDYLNKGTTVPQIASAFRQVHQAGLKGFAYMIIGFPGQTIRQMYDELIFLNKIRADYASFAVLSPYPQTELYRRLLTEGLIPYDFWQDFAEHPSSDFTMPISFTGYSRKELRRTQVRLTQIFYFNPLFLFRTALSLRNFTQMKNHAKIALNLIWGK